ncbi:uncharacterized protein LOC117183061 [Belonocnema kinseyi]|uniref:uncharacterized protein LOC117183061 n=1 Tax=Belonocnema kinseyi TaxID=2817044 RepID=UPI00143CFA5A|nr:uncharacterized protein LOC117183061 [Belonocnema kinseyi]
MNIIKNFFYGPEQIRKLPKAFNGKLESIKRSILYDFHSKIDQLNRLLQTTDDSQLEEALQGREILPPFPTTKLEDFLTFEKDLTEVPEVTAAFNLLDFSTATNAVLPMIMMKAVQMEYSAFGRKSKNPSKLNFSRTNVYSMIKEIMLQKYPKITVKYFNREQRRGKIMSFKYLGILIAILVQRGSQSCLCNGDSAADTAPVLTISSVPVLKAQYWPSTAHQLDQQYFAQYSLTVGCMTGMLKINIQSYCAKFLKWYEMMKNKN